jgi:hypothetical protein
MGVCQNSPARSLSRRLRPHLHPHQGLHSRRGLHQRQGHVLRRRRAHRNLWLLCFDARKLVVITMEKNQITGGCYCGEVRFSATSEIRVSTNCHCANCRRAAGAQAVAWIIVERSQFEFVKGAPRRYRTATGAWRTFCDQCGTSLTYETDRRPEEIDITIGSLDHPENFPPTKDVYPEERLPWVDLIHA